MTSHQPTPPTHHHRATRSLFSFFLAVFCLTFISAHAQDTQSPLIPADSAMAKCAPEWPRILLNPCEDGGGLLAHRTNIWIAKAEPYQGVEPKIGRVALKFSAEASLKDEAKITDFVISKTPPGRIQYIGAWMYLTPESNVSKVGFQILDNSGNDGKPLVATVPADWKGWKWVEFNTQDATFAPPDDVKKKSADAAPADASAAAPASSAPVLPLRNIHFIWFATKGGMTSVGLDGVAAVAKPDPSDKPYTVEVSGSNDGEANGTFNGQLVVNNFSDKPIDVELAYSMQTNPQLYDKPLADPVVGNDRAIGSLSWIEFEGKRIENHTLTDGEAGTNFTTNNFPKGGGLEVFQFIDFGQARKITKIQFDSGDAKWLHKVDLATSPDGTEYTPVEGMQGIIIANKWGRHDMPVPAPFSARFLRLRYHNDGNPMTCNDEKMKTFIAVNTFDELYVYDGIQPSELELPQVGTMVEQKTVKMTAPPHNFALLPITMTTPLKTGSYYFGARVTGPSGAYLYTNDYFARSAQELKVGPESRFGMNTAQPGYSPELKRLGVGWVRFENMKWGFFNEAPNQFKYARDDIPLDTWMHQYHDAGLSILPYIFQTPPWDTSSPDGKRKAEYPPKDYADYGKAMYQTVARYGSTKHPDSDLLTNDKISGLDWIHVYELWNEPDNPPSWGSWEGSIEQYFDLYRVGAEQVKKADPKAIVTTAGFSGISMSLIDKVRSYKYPDGKCPLDFSDILNIHRYTGKQEPELATADPNAHRDNKGPKEVITYENQLIDIADWRDHYKPAMPVWLTETGNDVGGPMGRTERYQAAKIPRDLMLCLANGMEKVFLYREVGSTPGQHAGSGVIREDTTFRPSYFTMATLTRQLDGVTDLRTLRLQTSNPNVRMYNWNRGKDHVFTAWTPQDTQPLGLDLGKCHVVDAFGAESDVEVTKDFVLTIFPVYITQITNPAPIAQLETEALAREDARKKALSFP